jgi:glycosyltransferase involved in cell wall biosynthesis
MKISIVQGAFYPVPTRRGGAIEKIWFHLGREFARRGHEVLHVSRLCDGLPAAETIDGVQHWRVPSDDAPRSRLHLKWRDYLYTRRVARILPRSDVVVTNTFFAPLLLKPARHGPLWVHVQRYPQGQMKYYGRAARLQTVSGVIARAMVAQAPAMAPRIQVIPNPLPPVADPGRVGEKDPNLVLYVGRLHPEKGIELLLAAMVLLRQHHPEARLRVIGPWEERHGGAGAEFMLRLRTLAMPLGKAVEFTGPVFDEAALSAHYEEAGVFVYPSLAGKGEASPVAPLEALAHGLPVVVSDLECFDEYLQPGPFVQRFNHEAAAADARLAGVLERLLAPAADRPAVAAAARARAAEFSVERIAQLYLDAFAGVASAALPV